jgi:hypothetical protein
VIMSYAITLIFEFPFVALIFSGNKKWLRKAIIGSLIIQTVSYALLFGWYWKPSAKMLFTETRVVPLSNMTLPDKVRMYYISSEDGDVYMRSLSSSDAHKVFDLNSTQRSDCLSVRENALVAHIIEKDKEHPKEIAIVESLPEDALPKCYEDPDSFKLLFNALDRWGEVPKLGIAKHSEWSFRTKFWEDEGLQGTHAKTGAKVHFGVEIPFLAWHIRNATHLPADKILFRIGKDQICVFDPEYHQLALVTRGWGPIAVMDETPAKAGS